MDVTGGGAGEPAAGRPPVSGRRRSSGRAEPRVHSLTLWRTLAAVVVLAVSPAGRVSALQCADGSAPPCQASAAHSTPPPNSVAGLYFDNLSAHTTHAHLADGLTQGVA